MNEQEHVRLIIVTGQSGAGKSSVLKTLEDLGFFCVDNLPVPLLSSLLQFMVQTTTTKKLIAIGIDVRSCNASEQLVEALHDIRERGICQVHVIFVTAQDNVLIKRFQETRRQHPLAYDIPFLDALTLEKKLLQPLMDYSDTLLETDQLTIHQLRQLVRTTFLFSDGPPFLVNVISFGFKYGLPYESNFVYDVRSLPNPYFIDELRVYDGRHEKIRTYLFAQPEVMQFWDKFYEFVCFCIDTAMKDGRSFLTIAVGCTGGKHRSVAFIHRLAREKIDRIHFVIKHRDLHKENKSG